MKLYQVTVQFSRTNANGWHEGGGLPIFYLRDDMHGIVSEVHAEKVARYMLESIAPGTQFHISIGVSPEFAPETIGA